MWIAARYQTKQDLGSVECHDHSRLACAVSACFRVLIAKRARRITDDAHFSASARRRQERKMQRFGTKHRRKESHSINTQPPPPLRRHPTRPPITHLVRHGTTRSSRNINRSIDRQQALYKHYRRRNRTNRGTGGSRTVNTLSRVLHDLNGRATYIRTHAPAVRLERSCLPFSASMCSENQLSRATFL